MSRVTFIAGATKAATVAKQLGEAADSETVVTMTPPAVRSLVDEITGWMKDAQAHVQNAAAAVRQGEQNAVELARKVEQQEYRIECLTRQNANLKRAADDTARRVGVIAILLTIAALWGWAW